MDLIENGSRQQRSRYTTQGNVNIHADIEDLQVRAASGEVTGVSVEDNINVTQDCSDAAELMTSEFCSRCKRLRFREK